MKYYKITNEKEIHYKMHYKDGLNIDILPFNPSGDCEPGGIYFSKEDILAFLDYGPWIREVTLPEGEEIYKNPGEPVKFKAHQIILGPRHKINVDIIKELIEDGADIHAKNDCALRWASENSHLDIVKVLIENGANIHAGNDYALRWASENGHLNIVKILIENGANIHAGNDFVLKWASENGHLDVVKVLIEKGANIHAGNDEALRWASENGHLDIVNYLKSIINDK